jgi:hypothetical protein
MNSDPSAEPVGVSYWLNNTPILLASLAAMSPGMTPLDVAEVLDELDNEVYDAGTVEGEALYITDDELVGMYITQLVVP